MPSDVSIRKPRSDKKDDKLIDKNKKKLSFKERIIIEPERRWKTIFDVIVLILVGYSCVTNVYYVAFS